MDVLILYNWGTKAKGKIVDGKEISVVLNFYLR